VANFTAVYSVGDSLISYLRHVYDLRHVEDALPSCNFVLVPSEKLGGESDTDFPPEKPCVSLYLFRVTVNEHLRNQRPPPDKGQTLMLDLHYMLTVWADKVDDEQRLLSWVMQQLWTHEALSASDLTPDGGWAPGDLVQIIPAEISHEDLTRLWDSLKRSYRPSVTYVARVVPVDVTGLPPGRPVVARRLTFGDQVPE
jgi:hypothetical protein